jgi:hypothetical protein
MNHGIPEDIRWMIEANYQVSLLILLFHTCLGQLIALLQRNVVQRLKVWHQCARWICNAQCRSLGMVSINREDKI